MKPVELLPNGEPILLERYQLIGELASGGMATVYLARLAGVGGFQRFVAIKRLHPHLAKAQDFVEMFLDEARLAASIHHQNVVPILEIGTSSDGYYLVMEYVEGVTLARLMAQATQRQKPVPPAILLRIAIDMLCGLHAAHELTDDNGAPLGLVHRDCSPQNVLVGLDGATRIADFGIARASSRIANTREGEMKGKLAYMAPEQTQGDDIDRRADLFSVGVVLWEVLTGRRLFKASTEAATLRRLLADPIPKPSDINKVVPAAIDRFCMRALERAADARFQTAAEMADALEQVAREGYGDDAVATVRVVAAYMGEVCGADVSQQRDSVRDWLSATPSRVGMPRPSRPGSAPPSVPLHVDSQGGVPSDPRASGPGSFPPSSSERVSAGPSAPGTNRGWLGIARTDRPSWDPAASEPPPSQRAGDDSENDPASASVSSANPSTARSWPVQDAPDEDATQIYESHSNSAVTAAPRLSGIIDEPSTYASAQPPKRRLWPWGIAALFAAAIGAFVALRGDEPVPIDSAAQPQTEVAPAMPPAPVATGGDDDRSAAGSSTASSGPAARVEPPPIAARPSPTFADASGDPLPLDPPPAASSVAPPPPVEPATASAAPPPPPPPPPSDLDADLSNPYR